MEIKKLKLTEIVRVLPDITYCDMMRIQITQKLISSVASEICLHVNEVNGRYMLLSPIYLFKLLELECTEVTCIVHHLNQKDSFRFYLSQHIHISKLSYPDMALLVKSISKIEGMDVNELFNGFLTDINCNDLIKMVDFDFANFSESNISSDIDLF